MQNLFLSAGPDLYAHLRTHLANIPPVRFEGVWATVEIQPDAFARQRYTVGVVVACNKGRVEFRLLENFALLVPILGGEGVQRVRVLVAQAGCALQRAQQAGRGLDAVCFEANGILLGELWYTSGEAVETTVARLYADVVPFDPNWKRGAL